MATITVTRGTTTIPTIADDDILVFEDGDQIVNGGLSNPTIDLQKLVVSGAFEGQIGNSTTAFDVDVSNVTSTTTPTLWYLAKSGSMRIGAASRLYDNVVIQSAAGKLFAIGGTWASVRNVASQFEGGENADIQTMYQWGGWSEIGYNSNSIDNLYIRGSQRFGTAYVKTQRDGVYHLTGPSKLEVDHTNSTPAIDVNTYDERAVVVVKEGDIDDVRREAAYIDLREARKPVSIGGTTHVAGPAEVTGIYQGDALNTIGTVTYLGGASEAPPTIPAF
jgi:hypothetical protein